MGAPQIIYIVLLVASLTVELVKHGERKDGRHSFPAAVVGAGLFVSLLWWGGFFGS